MSDMIRTTAEAHESTALPQARVVHADPDACSAEQKPLPDAMARKPVAEKSAAEWAYERLILYIQNFEEQLDSEHEIAMGFAGSDTGVMRIEGIGFFDPDIVTFYGTDAAGTDPACQPAQCDVAGLAETDRRQSPRTDRLSPCGRSGT